MTNVHEQLELERAKNLKLGNMMSEFGDIMKKFAEEVTAPTPAGEKKRKRTPEIEEVRQEPIQSPPDEPVQLTEEIIAKAIADDDMSAVRSYFDDTFIRPISSLWTHRGIMSSAQRVVAKWTNHKLDKITPQDRPCHFCRRVRFCEYIYIYTVNKKRRWWIACAGCAGLFNVLSMIDYSMFCIGDVTTATCGQESIDKYVSGVMRYVQGIHREFKISNKEYNAIHAVEPFPEPESTTDN